MIRAHEIRNSQSAIRTNQGRCVAAGVQDPVEFQCYY